MAKYLWDSEALKWVEAIERPLAPRLTPYIQCDLPAYFSPLSMSMVEGRAARREEMKRTGTREVDPSEKYDIGRATAGSSPSDKALEHG